MKWGDWGLLTFLMIIFALYEWSKMDKGLKKERAAYAVLNVTVWMLSLLLVLFPKLPGPTQLVEAVLKPLSKILETK
ncbi:hypothetical protein ACFPYJ_29760 [Paenibacillus solisilvae]|uniref:Uncharacterized protein n=1 Tax=Paenibacillus solisilvae TaxID=2486751 RepID=A0ABW0W579_9BACL